SRPWTPSLEWVFDEARPRETDAFQERSSESPAPRRGGTMKSCVVVAGCLLSFACGESWAAGINLAWTECLGSGGASDRTVACTNGATAENVLFLSFVVPAGIPRLGTVDASIDVQTASALGSWWLGGRGVVCPSAAPSIPVTWGSIKNLYR